MTEQLQDGIATVRFMTEQVRGIKASRLMIAAPSSGSGKTLLSCALLRLLRRKGCDVRAYKCGPDFIDPLLHREILGRPSHNLDTWFTGPEGTRALFASLAAEDEAAIHMVEGVMGYFDGIGGVSTRASSAELAQLLGLPVLLVVDARGMSRSVLALLRGFLAEERSLARGAAGGAWGIRAVFLNRVGQGLYERLKPLIEEALGLPVVGYLPTEEAFALERRHLGLRLPGAGSDREAFLRRVDAVVERLEGTLDLEALLAVARSAEPLETDGGGPEILCPEIAPAPRRIRIEAARRAEPRETGGGNPGILRPEIAPASRGVRIAVARDAAFCFLYEENLELLRALGAELVFFSPLSDREVPEAEGAYLPGGYPELFAEALAENRSMAESLRRFAIEWGKPLYAECGGFLYLQRSMRLESGKILPMAGVLEGEAFWTGRSQRFGYASYRPVDGAAWGWGQDKMESVSGSGAGSAGAAEELPWEIRGHEFHYFDCTDNGAAFLARKPQSQVRPEPTWPCMVRRGNVLAGFPHLYFPSAPSFAAAFARACGRLA